MWSTYLVLFPQINEYERWKFTQNKCETIIPFTAVTWSTSSTSFFFILWHFVPQAFGLFNYSPHVLKISQDENSIVSNGHTDTSVRLRISESSNRLSRITWTWKDRSFVYLFSLPLYCICNTKIPLTNNQGRTDEGSRGAREPMNFSCIV